MYTPLPYQFAPDEIAFLLSRTTSLDLAPGPGGTRMSDPQSTRFYLEEGLKIHPPFHGEWTYASVVAIYPGAQIQAHKDAPITGRRLHVPLQQNEGCWSFSDDGGPQEPVEDFVYRIKTYFRTNPGYDAADLRAELDIWQGRSRKWQQLDLGQTYRMDPTLPHGAVNWGSTLRLNLLVDVQG